MIPLQILHQHPKTSVESPHQLHRDDSYVSDSEYDESQADPLVDEKSNEVDSDSPHLKRQRRRLVRHRIHIRAYGASVILGLFVACALIVLDHPCHHRSGLAVGVAVRTGAKAERATDPRRSRGDGIYRLPPADRQTWAHSATSREDVTNALADESVTAIESDIIMGYVASSGSSDPRQNETETEKVAIMAHPPATTGDLSVRDFLEMVSYPIIGKGTNDSRGSRKSRPQRALRKHVKLDFKTIDAVRPALDAIEDLGIFLGGRGGFLKSRSVLTGESTSVDEAGVPGFHAQRLGTPSSNGKSNQQEDGGKTVFLNANVLPGPGHRWGPQDTWLDGDEFLDACLGHKALNSWSQATDQNAADLEDGFAFSLGYVTDNTAVHGFSESDVEAMSDLVRRHNLTGVVLAVNARILAKDPTPFDAFFDEVPASQILAWTGKFLLPISRKQVEKIKAHFRENGGLDRVGFDIEMAGSFVMGVIYDLLYTVSSALLYLLKGLVSWFYVVNGKVC